MTTITRSASIGETPLQKYVAKIRLSDENSLRIKWNVFSIRDIDANMNLSKGYVFIRRFLSEGEMISICTCGTEQCLHLQACRKIYGESLDDNVIEEDAVFEYAVLQNSESSQLYGVFSQESDSYSIVKKTKCVITCKSVECKERPRKCSHTQALEKIFNMPENPPYIQQPFNHDELEFEAISKKTIVFPFLHEDRAKFLTRSYGYTYPTQLYPAFDPELVCQHNNTYDDSKIIPVKVSKKSVIHLPHRDIECTTYYRPTVGECDCRQYYDGRDEHLFNLDNIHIFPYTWLLEIKLLMQESSSSIYSCYKAANHLRVFAGDGRQLTNYFYNLLRKGYNSFIRLLGMSYKQLYHCKKCPRDGPNSIGIDAVMMGVQQRYMPRTTMSNDPLEQVEGSTRAERVFGLGQRSRILLANYTNLSRGKYKANVEAMEEDLYDELCENLQTHESVKTIVEEMGNHCHKDLQKILGELSKESPTSAILQICGDQHEELRVILHGIASGNTSTITIDAVTKGMIKKSCPVFFVDFLFTGAIDETSKAALLDDLLRSAMACYDGYRMPLPTMYGDISESFEDLEYFPNYEQNKRGRANYSCDTNNENLFTGCKKDSVRHARLAPGLLTIFCEHSICIGFQIMRVSESPRIPFDILVRRFHQKMPKIIVYDNSCKLHLFCLKREPALFKNTKFCIDRFHQSGHVGCTIGYSMSQYINDPAIANINSQVNEQANADLRRLGLQIPYMRVENALVHIKDFLAIRNLDKKLSQ